MADDTAQNPQPPADDSRANERITQLSDKVKQEATRAEAAEAERAAALKRATFAEGFAEVLGTHPTAKEFKAEIQAKVDSGYSVQDAATVVLVEKGKFGITHDTVVSQNPAGGSADTALSQTTEKTVNEMSLQEKREALAGLSAQEMFAPFRAN